MKLKTLFLLFAAGLCFSENAFAQDVNPTPGTTTERQFSSERAALGAVWQQMQAPIGMWSYAAATGGIAASTTAVTIKAAAAAGKRNYITGCSISHDALGNVTELVIRDGAAGTVLFRRKLQVTAIEGLAVDFSTPLRGTAATLLEVVTLTSATGGVFVNCQGYTD